MKETQTEKQHKSKKCVRDAVKRYKENIKVSDSKKYNELVNFHRAYSKEYYKKIKEERAQLKAILQTSNGKICNIIYVL